MRLLPSWAHIVLFVKAESGDENIVSELSNSSNYKTEMTQLEHISQLQFVFYNHIFIVLHLL